MVQVLVELSYEQIVEVVDKLTPEKKQALLDHLLASEQYPLTDEAKRVLVESITMSIPAGPKFSDRRSDWYDDDGR